MESKPWLKNITPYPPGKTLEEIKKSLSLTEKIYKLNSNENPLGPSAKVISALTEALKEIHLYPSANYLELKEAIAERWGILLEEIVLGNGSNEILEFVFKAFISPEEEILISQPSFLMYEKLAKIYGVNLKKIPLSLELKHNLKTIKANLTSKTKAIFLDHPHNPTGSTLPREEWEEFFRGLPSNMLVIIDEAYGDFIEDPKVPLGIEFLKKGYPVLITRTFSKAYGLAGLRLGYGIGPSEIIKELDKVRQPFNINLLAVKAGLSALKDEDYYQKTLETVKKGRTFLTQELSQLGFKVFPSQANFIMVDFSNLCYIIYKYLTKKRIFVRPLKPYGFESCLRITVGLEEENRTLVEAIKEIKNQKVFGDLLDAKF